MQPLGELPGGPFESIAFAVSHDGSFISGTSPSVAGLEAFRWNETSGMEGLGNLPEGPTISEAKALSASGDSVVKRSYSARSGGAPEAFIWTSGQGMIGLGDLPGGPFLSELNAVSADGSVVVGRSWSDYGTEPFIWTPADGMRSLRLILTAELGLNLDGWNIDAAYGISADGTVIVGSGVNPSGEWEAWRAVIPEPSSGGLIIAAMGIVRRRGIRPRKR